VESHEEEWRHRFYLSLGQNEILSLDYFAQYGSKRLAIDARSALIVYAFSRWPQGKTDLLEEANIADIVAREGIFNGQPGLQMYLQRELPEYLNP
jgi:hypothetical protein